MNIALIAHDKKKELMAEFCIAYSGIFKKHNLCATADTGTYIMDAIDLDITKVLSGRAGGVQQICARISYNEIDLVLFFGDPISDHQHEPAITPLLKLCDMHNIPVATNVATAEMLIIGLQRGDLAWRDIMREKANYIS